MSSAIAQTSDGLSLFGRMSRFVAAVGLTGFLIIFLIATRWIEPKADALTLRSMQGIDPVAMPAPPPPPSESESQPAPPPPPPAVSMELPKLDLSVDNLAPPVQAAMEDKRLDVMMKPAEFATAQPQTKARSLYSAADLDNQPRLLNRPNVTYPASLKNQGIREGKVILEVMINVSGSVSVRRVISSSHPDVIPMARAFASRSRFSPPKKDGRIVNAVFNWPLVLRP